MANPATLTNAELTDLVRSAISSRPGLDRIVTSILHDISDSTGNTAQIIIRIDRTVIGQGVNLDAVGDAFTKQPMKSKLSLDDGFSRSAGPGAADQYSQMPGGVSQA